MSHTIITNQAHFSGYYCEDECSVDFYSNKVNTTIIRGLSATKEADKKCWVDGPLTYTITVKNTSGATFSGAMFSDYLDPSVIALDTTLGVFIDSVPITTYTYSVGLLSVHLPVMEDGDSHTITFSVVLV